MAAATRLELDSMPAFETKELRAQQARKRLGKLYGTSRAQQARKDSVLEVRHRVHGGMDAGGAGPSTEFKMPDFEYSTPMLVMPFLQFKAQGRIMKSVQKWRDEALAQGWLVEFKEGEGKVAIFISHTWWDRDFKDETNDASDVYDKGSPDWQSGEKKNLKWRVICAGVARLIEEKGLEAENVMIWCDWQSSAPHIGAPNPGPADQRLACR